eukprot:gene16838-biopygen15856
MQEGDSELRDGAALAWMATTQWPDVWVATRRSANALWETRAQRQGAGQRGGQQGGRRAAQGLHHWRWSWTIRGGDVAAEYGEEHEALQQRLQRPSSLQCRAVSRSEWCGRHCGPPPALPRRRPRHACGGIRERQQPMKRPNKRMAEWMSTARLRRRGGGARQRRAQ